MSSADDMFDCAGKATDGKHYESIASMWASELEHADHDSFDTKPAWYTKSEAYWAVQKASVAGMLGGLDDLHTRDVTASRRFLNNLSQSHPIQHRRALDVGAGIGRVTRYLLSEEFDTVDLLEQSVAYINESDAYLDSVKHKVGRRIACGMQEFRATGLTARNGVEAGDLRKTYDVVWIQWTVIYLHDDDFVAFVQECIKCLTPNGIIVVKDNVARTGFLVDKDDSSIMRSNRYMLHLFKRAGVEVIKQARQLDFPKTVFPVRMFALKPSSSNVADTAASTTASSSPCQSSCLLSNEN